VHERTPAHARAIAVSAGILVAAMIAVFFLGTHPSHAERPDSGRSQEPASPVVDTAAGLPAVLTAQAAVQLAQLHDYVTAVAFADYVHGIEMGHVVDYANALAASEQQARAQEYATARAGAPVAPRGAVSGGGSCYGGPIPDYIVSRESGGNPNALNPSGAWGCYQIMPEWWSGACSSLDKYTIDGQKACAAILWNGGAGASNWALTR
jgi:hypothetical protein